MEEDEAIQYSNESPTTAASSSSLCRNLPLNILSVLDKRSSVFDHKSKQELLDVLTAEELDLGVLVAVKGSPVGINGSIQYVRFPGNHTSPQDTLCLVLKDEGTRFA